MPNSGEYKSTVGVDSLYVAEVTADAAGGYTAGTPIYLAPLAEVTAAPAVNSQTQYADDNPYDTFVNEGETVLTMTVTGIPPEILAQILGKAFDATTGRVYDTGAVPPEYALGFRSQKANGKYRYFWFLKGRFSPPSENFQTKTDSPAPQTTEITYTAVRTIYAFDVGSTNEKVKRVYGDEDTTNFSGTGWFSQVQVPGVATPSALALSSSVPTDGGTGISVSANITLTFNNALPDGAIYNVAVVKADGTAVACTNSLDATKKIVTINPDASLDASSTYIVTYALVDIYGQALNGAINFETA